LRTTLWTVVACLCLPSIAASAQEDPAADVSPKDWSYAAVEALAARGLVHGYKDARFLDGRSLTRFEMASLVKRILNTVKELPTPQAEDGRPSTAASRGLGNDPIPTGRPIAPARSPRTAAFTEADLGTVKRLADTYSVELAVIGVNLQDTLAKIQALEGRVEAVEKALSDPKGPLQKAINDVQRLDKIRFSGYVQSRFESFEKTREADPSGPRVPVTDRFSLRRMRLTLNARPNPNVLVKWELEGGALDIQSRDAFISYFVKGDPTKGHTVSIGQLKVPFGFEIAQSSGARETPERARPIRFFYPSERDRGVRITSPTGNRWIYELGVYNGVIGPGTQGIGTNDNNNNKDVYGRVRTTQLNEKLDAGVSFHFGNSLRTGLFSGEDPRSGGPPSAANPYENTRVTLGADLQYHLRKGTELRGEFLWGKAKGSYATGYILQVLHELSPKNQFVARYAWLGIEDMVPAPLGGGGTPVGDAVPYHGTLGNLEVGVIHRLNPNVRLKLFYDFNELGQMRVEYGRVPWQGNVLRAEVLTLF
jgi:hypothetical protein